MDSCGTNLALLLTIYYASIMNSTLSSNESKILTPSEVEAIVGRLNNNIVCAANSFIAAQPIHRSNDTVIGASFSRNYQSQIIFNSNQPAVVNSNISAATIFNRTSLADATILNILLIDKPLDYQHFTNLTNERLVSPVIVTNVRGKNSLYNQMNVSLFFRPENVPNIAMDNFICAYYDINSSSWNKSACTSPIYNSSYNRYECFCTGMSQSFTEFSFSSGKKPEHTLRLDTITFPLL